MRGVGLPLFFRYTGSRSVIIDLIQKITHHRTMVKRQTRQSVAQNQDKGKHKMVKPEAETRKRGRKTKQEVLENLLTVYSLGNPPQVRKVIHGWERESQSNEEDNEAKAEILDFITYPGNTKGRLSLFNQTVHAYWIMKCFLAKAMQSLHPRNETQEPTVMELLQDIDIQLQHIKVTQYQATDCIGRIEKQIQPLQRADIPGSTLKDPAPIVSSDG